MSTAFLGTEMEALPGLDAAKRLVRRLLTEGDRVHGVLLYGAEGSGKSTLARTLAGSWLCKQPGELGACGQCAACRAFEHGKSADLLEIAPKGSSNWIRLGAILPQRDDSEEIPIIEFLRTMPLMSRHKVVMMRSADRMTGDAANALLKTLEEPPEYGKLILLTSGVSAMLPTILSRCVTIQCESPRVEELDANGLDAQLIRALEATPGRISLALAHSVWFADLFAFANRLSQRELGEALKVSEEFAAMCERRKDEFEENPRTANCEALRVLAGLVHDRPLWVCAISQTHRCILGNGNSALLFDALFAHLLGA